MTVPAAELSGYGAQKADADALTAWLETQGFQIESVSADNTSIYASAPVAQIEQSLQVQMVRVSRDGFTYTAARNALISGFGRRGGAGDRWPAAVPAGSQAQQATAATQLQPQRARRDRARRPEPSPNISNSPPYLPSEILKAYNANGLGLDGTGQTIAILIDTTPDRADLQAFWKAAGLPADVGRVTVINVDSASLPATEGEETLDVSWTTGIAPRREIRVYCDRRALSSPLWIVRSMRSSPTRRPSMASTRISISLGLGETYMGGPKGEVAVQHQKFLKLAAAGVNVFVSTGDAGSNPDQTGHSPTGPLQAIRVHRPGRGRGGRHTRCCCDANGAIRTRPAWASGGGGRSVLLQALGVADRRRRKRSAPTAWSPMFAPPPTPTTGAFLILHGRPMGIGGTSWSAPVWAGLLRPAEPGADQGGSKTHCRSLNPQLYPLGGTGVFHDVNTGSNGAYKAAAGYDLVTGLGVPDVQALAKALT